MNHRVCILVERTSLNVLRQRRKIAQRRISAFFMALFCLWFGIFGAFLHTHCLPSSARAASPHADTASISSTCSTSSRTAKIHAAAEHHETQACAVCEWQTNVLSPALPIQTVVPPSHRAVRIVTHLPRYLSASPVLASSRAPPFTL
jgi:hypothetical protein